MASLDQRERRWVTALSFAMVVLLTCLATSTAYADAAEASQDHDSMEEGDDSAAPPADFCDDDVGAWATAQLATPRTTFDFQVAYRALAPLDLTVATPLEQGERLALAPKTSPPTGR